MRNKEKGGRGLDCTFEFTAGKNVFQCRIFLFILVTLWNAPRTPRFNVTHMCSHSWHRRQRQKRWGQQSHACISRQRGVTRKMYDCLFVCRNAESLALSACSLQYTASVYKLDREVLGERAWPVVDGDRWKLTDELAFFFFLYTQAFEYPFQYVWYCFSTRKSTFPPKIKPFPTKQPKQRKQKTKWVLSNQSVLRPRDTKWIWNRHRQSTYKLMHSPQEGCTSVL